MSTSPQTVWQPVGPPFAQLLLGVLPKASAWRVLHAFYPAVCSYMCAHACTHLHTPAHLPLLQTSPGSRLCSHLPLLKPGPDSFSPLSSNSLCPQCQQLAAVLRFSILGVAGRQRRGKHICELDVPWMFNQERQDCRGAQGRIGRCGLPRPLSSCCCFRLSCTSRFCPPCPWLGCWAGLVALKVVKARIPAVSRLPTHFLCSTRVSWG